MISISAAALRRMTSGFFEASGKREVARPDAGQLVFHRAAGRGDIGGPAGRDQRAGEIDGAALDPAGDQARDDLQHRRRAAFLRLAGDVIVASHSLL